MPASKKNQYKVRVDKQSVYNALKSQFPSYFGSYNWTDVKFFGDDPDDGSYLLWEMNEVNV